MTAEYLNLEPLFSSPELTSDFLVDKWMHSITEDPSFLTEWGAVEKARSLAFELGTYSGVTRGQLHEQVSHARSSTRLGRVRFSGDVDVRISEEDNFGFQQITVPHRAFSQVSLQGDYDDILSHLWTSVLSFVDDAHPRGDVCISNETDIVASDVPKILKSRINDAWHHPLPPEMTQHGQGEPQEEDPDVIPEPIRAPAFVHDLFTMAERHGAFTDLDAAGDLFVRTWYIHHVNLPRDFIPRIIELHEDWRRWEGDILTSWREFILPHEDVHLHVAFPDPYRGYMNRITHADLLVSQGVWAPRRPGLVTVHYQGRQMGPTNYAVAASFHHRVSGRDIANAADALHWCADPGHRCRILFGWTEIPFTAEPIHRMESGHAFAIHIWSTVSQVQSTGTTGQGTPTNVEQDGHDFTPLSPGRPPDDPNEEGDDQAPMQIEAQSDTSIHSGDMSVLVYRLNAPDGHCFVPWTQYMSILDAILHELRLPPRDFRCFHTLAVTPVDVQEDVEEVVILQSILDVPAGSTEKLILIDLTIHFHPLPSGLIVPAATSRKVARVQPHLHRQQLLLMHNLEDYCALNGDRCTITKNHRPWHVQDRTLHRINHGDYVTIQVPPPEDPHLDTEVAIQVARDFATDELTVCSQSDAALRLYQQTVEIFKKAVMNVEDINQAVIHFKTDPAARDQEPGPPRAENSRATGTTSTPTGVCFHDQQHDQLHRIVERADLIECEEEGLVAYITTWYVHHNLHKECRQPRPLRLTMPSQDWPEIIAETWNDIIVADEQIFLRLILPQPPCTDLECNQAHVIIEQGHQENHVAFLISVINGDRQRFGRSTVVHSAHSDTALQNVFSIIRLARPQRISPDGTCRVYWRQFPFAMFDHEEVDAGASLVVQVHEPHPDQVPDWINLMQVPRAHAVGLPSGTGNTEETRFCLNPYAASFRPQRQNILGQSEFIQTLQPLWDIAAFSWAGDENSGSVAVWFVDHHWQVPHCMQHRLARLGEDFTSWEQILEHTWIDHRIPGTELEFNVVQPRPATHDPTIIAHVILIQRPREDWVTSIVTTFDVTTPNTQIQQGAITTHEHILLESLLSAFGLLEACVNSPITRFCNAWWQNQPLQLGRPIMGRSGYNIEIQHITTIAFFAQRAPQNNDNVVMLQLHRLIQPSGGERLTSDAVAQAHWPPLMFKSCDTKPEDDDHYSDSMKEDSSQLIPFHLRWCSLEGNPPRELFLPEDATEQDCEKELDKMGHQAFAYGLGNTGSFLCVPYAWQDSEQHFHYYYVSETSNDRDSSFLHTASTFMTELAHMRLLYQMGFPRAVILSIKEMRTRIYKVIYGNNKPTLEKISRSAKTMTPWTKPSVAHQPALLLDFAAVPPELHSDRLLPINFDLLQRFFQSTTGVLCPWHDHLELPETTKHALGITEPPQPWDQLDRLIIYTDGSSQGKLRRKPPLWVEEFATSDSWAFIVLGERYDRPSRPGGLCFLGWQAHNVVYQRDTTHYLGTDHIGSEHAERESLFWAGLWRLATNWNIPTVFRADSLSTTQQASGLCGATHADATYVALRATFQALQAGLQDGLTMDHVTSHTDEPWNDMVDYLAKLQASQDQKLQRQDVDLRELQPFLPYMWMVLETNAGLPQWGQQGFDVKPPNLPGPHRPHINENNDMIVEAGQYDISFLTMNVNSLYKGPEGVGGKLCYLRQQVREHGLNFAGIQEARSDAGTSWLLGRRVVGQSGSTILQDFVYLLQV